MYSLYTDQKTGAKAFYRDRIGKPLYTFARKNGFSKTGSIAFAHIPGALFHTAPLVIPGLIFSEVSLPESIKLFCIGLPAVMFLASEFNFTREYVSTHNENVNRRKSLLEETVSIKS